MLALEELEQLKHTWLELLADIKSADYEIVFQSFRPFIEKGIVPGAYFRIENSDVIYRVETIRKLAYGVVNIEEPDKIINAALTAHGGSTIDRFILLPDYEEPRKDTHNGNPE